MKKLLTLCLVVTTFFTVGCTGPRAHEALNKAADALNGQDVKAFEEVVDLTQCALLDYAQLRAREVKTIKSPAGTISSNIAMAYVNAPRNRARVEAESLRAMIESGALLSLVSNNIIGDTPWWPEGLRNAIVEESGSGAVAEVKIPAGTTFYLALRKQGDNWRVVGMSRLKGTAHYFTTSDFTKHLAAAQQ